MQVQAKYIRYNPDMSVKEVDVLSIDVESGDRVLFIDNSFLDKCYMNNTPERSNTNPAGWQSSDRYQQIEGTVLRTDSVQIMEDKGYGLGPRMAEMPIVVLGDDDSVIYCNAVHIQKI